MTGTIKKFTNNQELIKIIDKYSNGNRPLGSLIREIAVNSENSEMIVPVLGMQGMGKSTLINAMLAEDILPSDADETTCVPVEIKYGEDEQAIIFFNDRSEQTIVHKKEELQPYVDNVENPANCKGVSHIILYRKNELLKNGLTIVDLPGIGSLTAENEKTTQRYIRNLCTAVFVIPVNPTLRRKEITFIKSIWSQFTKAFFVQNHWDDETDEEVCESTEFNTAALKQTAEELNVSFNDNIIIVNAYQALTGALQKNEEDIKASNISALMEEIRNFEENHKEAFQKELTSRISSALTQTRFQIEEKLLQLKMSKEDICRKKMREYEAYCHATAEINDNIISIEKYLSESEFQVSRTAREASRRCAGDIRKTINNIIDSGITDGNMLNDAFIHAQDEASAAAFEEMFSVFMKIKMELETKLSNLENVIDSECNMSADTIEFNKKSEIKFEKSFELVGGIVASVGGLALGNTVSTAITSATVGIAASEVGSASVLASLAGPIGIIVGIGIAAAGFAASAHAQKAVTKSRASETKREISKVIDDIENDICQSMTTEFKKISLSIKKVLNNVQSERKLEEIRLNAEIHNPDIPDDIKSCEQQMREELNYILCESGVYYGE